MDSTDTHTSNSRTAVFFSGNTPPPGDAAPAATRRRRPWTAAFAAGAIATVAAGALVACGPGPAPAGTAGSEPAPSAAASPATVAGSVAPVGPSVRPSVPAARPSVPAAGPSTPAAGPSAPAAGPSGPGIQPSISPSAQPSASAVGATTNGRYVSASAGASFVLPDGWTVEESTARTAGSPGTTIVIFNEARMQVAGLYHGGGQAGGEGVSCGPGPYTMTELDTAAALDNPWATAAGVRFSYRVLDMRADGGAFDYQIGLVDNASGQLGEGCLMSSFVAAAPQGTLSFADRASQSAGHDDPMFTSMAEAKDYMLTPDYLKLKTMILSLEMQD